MKSITQATRPMILLFGDSLTEQGFGMNGKIGWASLLAADYSRRADVFNRGFFGYNSQHAVDLLPSLPFDDQSPCLFCTVYFGANDATTPGSRQYISEGQFASNLSNVVTTIQNQQKQSRSIPVILMTPPPLDSVAWTEFRGLTNRSNERHKLYGEVVKEVAQRHNCAVLDVWSLLEGDKSVETYNQYLTDGLHLNELGNRKLYSGLSRLIYNVYPELVPQKVEGENGIPLEGQHWEELC